MAGPRSVHAHVRGVVLAAGEGRRMGMPKALVRAADGRTWLRRTLGAEVGSLRLARFGDNMRDVAVTEGDKVEAQLRFGVSVNTYGVNDLVAVVGARASDVQAELRTARESTPSWHGAGGPEVLVTKDWREGMGASLRAVLEQGPGEGTVDAVLVMLVDLPDVGPDVVRRVLDHVDAAEARGAVLARATYDGRPGHPVLVGRDHWGPMAATLAGDEGGRHYLAEHRATLIECGDLAGGQDQDTPTRTPGPE